VEKGNIQLTAGHSQKVDRFTDIPRYIVVQSTEHNTTFLHSWCIDCARLYDHLLNIFGDRGIELPFRNLGVFLASGTRRGGENMQLEVRVWSQKLDESGWSRERFS
jgi:hypothetical protein